MGSAALCAAKSGTAGLPADRVGQLAHARLVVQVFEKHGASLAVA